MECRDVKKLLSEYIDGVLVEGQVPVVKQHLGTCSECKAAYETMNRMIDVMRDMDTVSEPADFGASVRARLQTQPSLIDRFRSLVSPPLVKVPLGVAAALIVAFAITQIPGPDQQVPVDTAVTGELQSFETTSEPSTGRREKKGEDLEEEPAKDLAGSIAPPASGDVLAGKATETPARSNEAKKEVVEDETSLATARQRDTDIPPVGKDDTSSYTEAVEVDALEDIPLTDMPAMEQKIAQPSAPASEPAEIDERSRITTAVASTGGTIIETEGDSAGEVEYLIVRLPADSIWSLVRILGEDTELITASEFDAFGLQEKRSETEMNRVQAFRTVATESLRKSRAAIDSIFVRILVK